jgi:hypothetical protein
MVSQLRLELELELEFDLTCGLFDLTCGEDIFVHYICVLTQIYKFSISPVRGKDLGDRWRRRREEKGSQTGI